MAALRDQVDRELASPAGRRRPRSPLPGLLHATRRASARRRGRPSGLGFRSTRPRRRPRRPARP
jgi:hypothetical protein